MKVLHTIPQMVNVIKQFKKVYFIIGFGARAQYKSLSAVITSIKRDSDAIFDSDTLILYGGDDARNQKERCLGHLVQKIKAKYGCQVMGVVCDRKEYEPFIDYVVVAKPQHDANGIVYAGYKSKEILLGNTAYYLAKSVRKHITCILICGGGGFGLREVQYVISYTDIPYIFVKSEPRYKSVYKTEWGPIYDYLAATRTPLAAVPA